MQIFEEKLGETCYGCQFPQTAKGMLLAHPRWHQESYFSKKNHKWNFRHVGIFHSFTINAITQRSYQYISIFQKTLTSNKPLTCDTEMTENLNVAPSIKSTFPETYRCFVVPLHIEEPLKEILVSNYRIPTFGFLR